MIPEASGAPRRTVLVVDDEHILRADSVESFEDDGFEVIEAYDAKEAIRVLETHDDIGVVFTDIIMPGGPDGLELAKVVRQRWPAVWIIFASGTQPSAGIDFGDRCLFFLKPYKHEEVVARIRTMIHV